LFRVENGGECASKRVVTFKIHFYNFLNACITIILLYMRAIGHNSHRAVAGAGAKSNWKTARAKPTVTALDVA